MNVFERVQESAHQLAAIISMTLGTALLASGCWALHETLGAESEVYFVIGYMSGLKQYPAKILLDELNRTVSPYITILKACFSTVILVGVIQLIGALFAFKWVKIRKILIGWITCLIIATILSIISAVVPLAIGLRGYLELNVVATISGVNAFIIIHVIVVLIFELRSTKRGANKSCSSSTSTGTTSVLDAGLSSVVVGTTSTTTS